MRRQRGEDWRVLPRHPTAPHLPAHATHLLRGGWSMGVGPGCCGGAHCNRRLAPHLSAAGTPQARARAQAQRERQGDTRHASNTHNTWGSGHAMGGAVRFWHSPHRVHRTTHATPATHSHIATHHHHDHTHTHDHTHSHTHTHTTTHTHTHTHTHTRTHTYTHTHTRDRPTHSKTFSGLAWRRIRFS